MLERIEVSTSRGNTLSIPLNGGDLGYFILPIDGLDPVKATLVSSSVASSDGEVYQSSRREGRNIVFKIGVDTSQLFGSVSALRRKLQSFLMPKSEVTLRFFSDDMPTVEIVARVESFDFPLFVQEPEATVSVMCYDPDFIDPEVITVSGTSTTTPVEGAIEYVGDVETGVVFRITIPYATSQFSIRHRSSDNTVGAIDFSENLLAGDIIEISTVSGDKYVDLIRSNSRSSILWGMSPFSNWINLFPETNYISVVAQGAGLPYTIAYNTRYGGL